MMHLVFCQGASTHISPQQSLFSMPFSYIQKESDPLQREKIELSRTVSKETLMEANPFLIGWISLASTLAGQNLIPSPLVLSSLHHILCPINEASPHGIGGLELVHPNAEEIRPNLFLCGSSLRQDSIGKYYQHQGFMVVVFPLLFNTIIISFPIRIV